MKPGLHFRLQIATAHSLYPGNTCWIYTLGETFINIIDVLSYSQQSGNTIWSERTDREMSYYSNNSLHELPLPYDISSAVSRALRLDSIGGPELPVPGSQRPLNSMAGRDVWSTSKAVNPRPSAYYTYNSLEDYALEDIQFEMNIRQTTEVDVGTLESQNSIEQLEEFCNYIDNEEDLHIPDPPDFDSLGRNGCRQYHSVSESKRSKQPPSKKRRKTVDIECPSGPDVAIKRYNWKISLANSDLWKKFDEIGTEMVITKNGR